MHHCVYIKDIKNLVKGQTYVHMHVFVDFNL